ncbi:hypothetical protein EDB89DRAFT_2067514 [Lactarius sanguifluus]|nr:hypothetical protein EDB89DRAFT_2067514 [Lactarius sanguifluus]
MGSESHSDNFLGDPTSSSSHGSCEGLISQSHGNIQEPGDLPGEVSAQGGYATTIDTLSDDVLLVIFDSYKIKIDELEGQLPYRPWKWDGLVHVCRRWRQIIFASPNRLAIRILCTFGTPVRSHLNYWPALPVVVDYNTFHRNLSRSDEDNLLAALEHPNRVCVLDLCVKPTQLGKLVTALQQPYPALTYLRLKSVPRFRVPVLPGGFLGGSASCLQQISLGAIPFPALPTLLLSTSHLVKLRLDDIPKAGYISPEAMIVGLAALTNLRSFCIDSGFRSTKSLPRRTSPSPVMRTVLPVLTSFEFLGVSGYLEDLSARIDYPQIKTIEINFHLPVDVDFRVAQLFEFINRSNDPTLTQFGWLDTHFVYGGDIGLRFGDARYDFTIQVAFLDTGWEVSHVVQMFSQFSTKLSDVRHLSIKYDRDRSIYYDDWVQFLHPFTAVRTLHLDAKHGGYDIPIGHTSETFADVLPALGLFYTDCPQVEFFEQFITACERSGRPVTVVRELDEFYDRLDPYLSKEDKDRIW